MPSRIIVLSGPIASGKTTLGDMLLSRFGFQRLKTRQLLAAAGIPAERRALQKAGEALDRKTHGEWVALALARLVGEFPEDVSLIVDAARIPEQVKAIRKAFGAIVTHVHLTADMRELRVRYARRSGDVKELESYEAARRNATERSVDELAASADVSIDTKQSSPEDVLVRVASHLGLYGRGMDALVDVLVGGQYGSEGKGNVASYLAREYDVLVRTGGPNAGHKVYAEPKPYTFHHLPSGTVRAPRAKIVLGPGAVLWIPRLLEEIADCELTSDRLFIDPQAMLIEESDRKQESQKLVGAIGSTGQGVGAATARKVLRSAAVPPVRLAKSATELHPYLHDTRAILDEAYSRGQRVFLEGTQGTGLSLQHGSYPYVTSRDTTVSGLLAEAGVAPGRVRKIVMVCRTYPIRVESPKDATSGPLDRELTWKDIARRARLSALELERVEHTSTTGRKRRVGEFDWALLRRSASLNGPTDIALTFADYLSSSNRDARRFDQLSAETFRFIEEVERVAGAPVSLIATRFNFRCIIDRRAW